LFLGIGVLGVGLRRAIALPPGGHFSAQEQSIICATTACIILVLLGIAATSEQHARRSWVWVSQVSIAFATLGLAALSAQIIATAVLLILFVCFVAQTAVLIAKSTILTEAGYPVDCANGAVSH